MRDVSRYALWSVGVATVVLVLKTAAYALTGSVALLSDALESIINVAVAAAAYIALRVSVKPPDANHPFGHYKAEYFSAVLEGVLIIVASAAIFREVYLHAQSPQSLDAPGAGIALNIVASAINAVWGFRLLRVAKDARSPALIADARHVLADVVSSIGVVGGVIAAVLSGWFFLDLIVAGLAGAYILWSGWRLITESVGGLMDQAVEPEKLAAIRTCIAREAHGAIEAHDIQTRHAGPATFIQFHLVVPSDMTVSSAHDICDRLENSLHDIVPGAHVTIHVEPEDKAKHAGIIVV